MNGLMTIHSYCGKTRHVFIIADVLPISTHVSKKRQLPTLSFHLLSDQLSLLIALPQLFRIQLVEPRLIH